MSQQPPEADVDPLDEDLTAYLDGELDEPARVAVEQRLATDAAFRQRLQALERSWDLLDLLPNAQASETFTRTTVAMTVETAAEEAETQQLQTRRKSRLRLIAGIAAVALAIIGGYGLVMFQLDAPNRQLVRDLRVIENVDQYHAVEDMRFLHRLVEEGLFEESEESTDAAY